MTRAKKYEKLFKFVKVTAKILPVPFPDTVYNVKSHFCFRIMHVPVLLTLSDPREWGN